MLCDCGLRYAILSRDYRRESGLQALPLSFSDACLWCTGAVVEAHLIFARLQITRHSGGRELGVQAKGSLD